MEGRPWEGERGESHLQPRGEASEDSNPADTLVPDVQPPEPRFLWSEPQKSV